jgi:type II secretory pathway component PulC
LPAPEDLPQLSVRGIVVFNNNSKSAIVGDMIVKEGDTVKGVKIYEITTDSVVFEKDGVRWLRGVE